MGTLGTVRTMGNGKNFYKNFDERREISIGALGAIGTMGTIGTMGAIGNLRTIYRNYGIWKTSLSTLMKIEKYLQELLKLWELLELWSMGIGTKEIIEIMVL